MEKNDWDLDDLLDFKYDHGVPETNTEKQEEIKKDARKDMERYKQMRKESKDSASDFSASEPLSHRDFEKAGKDEDIFEQFERLRKEEQSGWDKYDWDHKDGKRAFDRNAPAEAPVEEVDETPHHSIKEIEAIKNASQEAYDRYRSNYTKNKKRRLAKTDPKRVTRFDHILSIIYTIAFAVFALAMIIMDVLPIGMEIAMFAVLILLSLVILIQARKRGIQKWGKRLAQLAAMVLICLYGVGTVYALGTMSFLSDSSVNNESAVSNITKNSFNFIITGIDVDGTIDEEGRSDVNMVVTVNPSTHQILMTSIPRDYEVYMPDYDNAMDKLTHTGFYGVKTTIGAEEQLFDTTVNYYVKVNFTTVERFIDAIGGVDVESEYEFTPVKMKDWTVQKGMNHMNGKQALAFARERKAFPDGDHQRIKNQQLVFEALIKKATSSKTMILSYNKVLSGLRNYFEMSFSSREIRKLVKYQLAKEPDWKIYKNTVTGGDGLLPTYSTGGEYAYVMTQDPESIENAKSLMNAVLEGEDIWTDEDGNVKFTSGEGE